MWYDVALWRLETFTHSIHELTFALVVPSADHSRSPFFTV